MHSIILYEVYVLTQNRWALHAKYPNAERDGALWDARNTEAQTGRPTKVIRDTYYPDLNYSEEIIAYLSTSAKSCVLQREQKPKKTQLKSQTRRNKVQIQNERRAADSPQSVGSGFVGCLLVALAISLAIATGLTALFSMLLSAIPKFGIDISGTISSKILLYWYIFTFVLSTIALNRAYVPWRHLFAQRFKNKPAPETNIAIPAGQIAFEAERNTDTERDKNILKTLRGDVDGLEQDQPQGTSSPTSNIDTQSSEPQSIKEEAFSNSDETNSAKKENEISEEIEPPKEIEQLDDTDSDQVDVPTPLADMDINDLLMVKFLGEAVSTLRSDQEQFDAYTRFGMSLYLAGAAAALADQRGLASAAEQAVLAGALQLIGHSTAMVDSFWAKYGDTMDSNKNRDLIAAGAAAMKQYMYLDDTPARDVGNIIE